jgi:hypothetical protein
MRRRQKERPMTRVNSSEQGWELTRIEVDALLTIEVRLWSEVAARIDPRLHRCTLKNDEVKG